MTVTMVLQGMLRPDGLVELLEPVDLPSEPRPVTVTLTECKTPVVVPPNATPRLQREPGGFWPDESISVPFDLPRPGIPRPVKSVRATEPRLPDPVFISIEDGSLIEDGQ